MKITNIVFDHTQKNIADALQGMPFHDLMTEAQRNWELITEEYHLKSKIGGNTSETIELIVKAIPDEATKEETAILAAFIMQTIIMKDRRMRETNPAEALLRLLKREFGEDLD